jgi:hypothetical protein
MCECEATDVVVRCCDKTLKLIKSVFYKTSHVFIIENFCLIICNVSPCFY